MIAIEMTAIGPLTDAVAGGFTIAAGAAIQSQYFCRAVDRVTPQFRDHAVRTT